MARKIRLPHEGEEIDRLIQEIKGAVLETRTTEVTGVKVTYSVCNPWPDGMDPAMYDHDGTIYVPESAVRSDPQRADLSAYHEQVEICYKLAGRSHGYAHHRALLHEILAAKQVFAECGWREYVHSKVFSYPDWKLPNKSVIAARLCELLSADRPLRGKLLEVFKEARM